MATGMLFLNDLQKLHDLGGGEGCQRDFLYHTNIVQNNKNNLFVDTSFLYYL